MKLNSMKSMDMKSIDNKFLKGFNNILSPTLINLFIPFSLTIIVILLYIKYKKIELFNNFIQENFITTIPNPTVARRLSDGYIQSIINNYLATITNKIY